MIDIFARPHRRRNPLTGEWVLVSPQRTQRPWLGETETTPAATLPEYDPSCYLCPGNARVGGVRNPRYVGTFVFENDFAALRSENASVVEEPHPLLRAQTESGVCRVICFSPRHDRSLGALEASAVRGVVDVWAEQYAELGARDDVGWVQIFENRGAMMGASNPHPHCQIWAEATVANEGEKELRMQRAHREQHGSCLLCDYVAEETRRGERLVYANDTFAVVVPFWAVWPFEVLLAPRTHRADIAALTGDERDGLADAIRAIVARYDALFGVPFPYSMGFHQRPTDGAAHDEWHLHAHYYPPLLRSAQIRKFMVGYELLSQPQRDLTAEDAAARLRAAL